MQLTRLMHLHKALHLQVETTRHGKDVIEAAQTDLKKWYTESLKTDDTWNCKCENCEMEVSVDFEIFVQ